MRRNRRFTLLGAGLAALMLVAGCSSSADEGNADSDGSLVLYSGREEALVAPLIEQFTEETGIEVDVRYGDTPELGTLLLEEGDGTPAHVFLSQDAGALGALSKAELAATLPEDVTSQIPDGFTSEDDSWVGVTGRARVIAYDSEKLSEAEVPDSVLDLVDPEWKGRIGFPPGNASFQAFITALRVLEGEDEADAWVESIAENDPVLTEKNGATVDLVNSGELDLALVNHYYWYEDAAEAGADNLRVQLKFLPGDVGGIVNVTGAALLAGADGNADALAFIEFLVSEQAQTYFVENTFEYPLLPGVSGPEGLPTLESLVNPDLDLSDLDSLTESQELLAQHGLI